MAYEKCIYCNETKQGDEIFCPSCGHSEWKLVSEEVIITRHPALKELLVEMGVVSNTQTQVIEHASEDDVRNNYVYGVLPLHLAALATKVVTVDLNVPPEKRGNELTLDELRKYYIGVSTYVVHKK